MPTPTYKALANITLSSAAASVTFGSIPNTYRDLVIVINASPSTNALPEARFNSDTGNNYSYIVMASKNTSPTTLSTSGTFSVAYLMDNQATTNNPFMAVLHIMDYSATNKHKTMLVRSGSNDTDAGSATYASAHRWANTAAINTVLIKLASGNYQSGSTFALYGIES